MCLLLELFFIAFVGVLLLRVNVSSFFPFLVWIPVLGDFFNPWWVVGFSAVSIAAVWKSSLFFSHEDIQLGLVVSFFCLFSYSIFFHSFSFDFIIFPVLCVAFLFWFFSILQRHFFSAIFGFFWLLVGFWLVHERVIPLLLPAFFLGWYGSSYYSPSFHHSFSYLEKLLHAFIGCLAGLLPGLGPGILNSLWFSGRVSPVMGISNLIFSLGVYAQSGRVRSAFAAVLGDVSSIPWFMLIAGLVLGLFFFYFIDFFVPDNRFGVPSWLWSGIFVLALFMLGGLLPFLVWAGALSLRRGLIHFNLLMDSSAFILLPSILLFYFPYF